MTREEAKAEINKVFEPAFANYIITALTEGATPSERKTGKWIKHDTGHSIYYDCSLCSELAKCTETADDWHYKGNSPYSKDDMKREICPCIIATKDDENYSELFLSYHTLLTGKDKNVVRKNPQTLKLYFNTREEDVTSDIEHIGGMKIYEKITG